MIGILFLQWLIVTFSRVREGRPLQKLHRRGNRRVPTLSGWSSHTQPKKQIHRGSVGCPSGAFGKSLAIRRGFSFVAFFFAAYIER
jgi:hypothetical protein